MAAQHSGCHQNAQLFSSQNSNREVSSCQVYFEPPDRSCVGSSSVESGDGLSKPNIPKKFTKSTFSKDKVSWGGEAWLRSYVSGTKLRHESAGFLNRTLP